MYVWKVTGELVSPKGITRDPNRIGAPAEDEEVRMNPLAKFSPSHFRSASNFGRDSEYRGPNEGAVPSFSGMLWSMARWDGSLLAPASENRVRNSWYSSGMSMGASLAGGSSMASMSAELIAKVEDSSCRRFSFLAIFLNAVSETAAMLIGSAGCAVTGGGVSCAAAEGRAGGKSSALILTEVWAQAVVQRAESNSIVPAA